MKEKRAHERHSESLRMTIKPAEGDPQTLITSNVSESGLYLLARRGECLPVGTEIVVTPLRSADGTSSPPSIKGLVVHVSDKGMGIKFLEPSFT
jgi:hypothetical protein